MHECRQPVIHLVCTYVYAALKWQKHQQEDREGGFVVRTRLAISNVASAEDKLEYSEGVQVATSQEYGNDHCTCDKATTASILPITFGKGGAS